MNGIAAQVLPLVPFFALFALDASCLVDLASADEVRYMPKLTWALVICFLGPFGGIAYLSLGMTR